MKKILTVLLIAAAWESPSFADPVDISSTIRLPNIPGLTTNIPADGELPEGFSLEAWVSEKNLDRFLKDNGLPGVVKDSTPLIGLVLPNSKEDGNSLSIEKNSVGVWGFNESWAIKNTLFDSIRHVNEVRYVIESFQGKTRAVYYGKDPRSYDKVDFNSEPRSFILANAPSEVTIFPDQIDSIEEFSAFDRSAKVAKMAAYVIKYCETLKEFSVSSWEEFVCVDNKHDLEDKLSLRRQVRITFRDSRNITRQLTWEHLPAALQCRSYENVLSRCAVDDFDEWLNGSSVRWIRRYLKENIANNQVGVKFQDIYSPIPRARAGKLDRFVPAQTAVFDIVDREGHNIN